MKLDKLVLANTLGLTVSILWVLCALAVWLLPDLSLVVTKWWLHGLDISVLGSWGLTLENFLLGGLTLGASFWVVGYVFGWSWEKASGK
ncbi:MAG: hypothetical protein BMS9Abin34_148 [Patescibacteria group bacterium]|nr:MAG: hypothetical protein BMS9Abin34_148 [Patescibacteria group bacterium]